MSARTSRAPRTTPAARSSCSTTSRRARAGVCRAPSWCAATSPTARWSRAAPARASRHRGRALRRQDPGRRVGAAAALYFDSNLVKSLALLDAVLEAGCASAVLVDGGGLRHARRGADHRGHDGARRSIRTARSKLAIEHALARYGTAYGLRWAALRYFNAAGAHPDGSLREGHEPGDAPHPARDRRRARPAPAAHDVRRRLSDARRHLRPRLRPRLRSRGRSPRRARRPRCAAAPLGVDQPRQRRRARRSRCASSAASACSAGRCRTRSGPRREGDPAVLLASNARAR